MTKTITVDVLDVWAMRVGSKNQWFAVVEFIAGERVNVPITKKMADSVYNTSKLEVTLTIK